MNRFQSTLNQIKADQKLINKTELYLKDKLAKSQKSEIIQFPKCRSISAKNLVKAACILFILFGGSVGSYIGYKTPVSYISLDINPSIELGINVFDKVVTVKGYNPDGKKVLNRINVLGNDIRVAVNTVVISANENGFIDNDGTTVISLTSETDNTKKARELENEAEIGANSALREKGKTAVIVKGNVSKEFSNDAREQDITPGKLNLIENLQAVDSNASVDEYRFAKVKDIMQSIEISSGNNSASDSKNSVTDNKSAADNKEDSINNKNVISDSNSAATDNKNVTSDNKNVVSSSKDVANDSKITVTDNKNVSSDNKDSLSNNKEVPSDSKNVISCSNNVSSSSKDAASGSKQTEVSKDVGNNSKVTGNDKKDNTTSSKENAASSKDENKSSTKQDVTTNSSGKSNSSNDTKKTSDQQGKDKNK